MIGIEVIALENQKSHKLLIILTTYARGFNLPEIVESIVNQTFTDYKIYIADDCSPQNPEKICKEIIEKYPDVDIEYHRNWRNIGEGRNIRLALAANFDWQPKYLLILQEDNILVYDNWLTEAIKLMDQFNDVSYCAANVCTNGITTNKLKDIVIVNGLEFWRVWFSPKNPVDIRWMSCIFRFNAVFNYFYGEIKKDVRNGDDLLLMRFALDGNVALLPKTVLEIAYNQGVKTYLANFRNPLQKFVSVQVHYQYAQEYARARKADPQTADLWLLDKRLKLIMGMLGELNDNLDWGTSLAVTLKNYDWRITNELLNKIFDTLTESK